MSTWLLDSLSMVHRNRWDSFLEVAAHEHPYVVHVGIGWALARGLRDQCAVCCHANTDCKDRC